MLNLEYTTFFYESGTILSCLLLTSTLVCQYIVQNKETALTQAAYKGHTEIARLLIEAGANINLQDQVLVLSFISL